LCCTSELTNKIIENKNETVLDYEYIPIDIDFETFKRLKTTGSATESGIAKYV